MRGSTRARLAAAGLIGLSLAACASRPEGASTDATAGPTAGQSAGASSVATGPGAGVGQLTEADIQKYVQVRQFLEAQDPSLRDTLRSDDISASEGRVAQLLRGQHRAWPTPQQFVEMHRQIQGDPALRARVDAALAAAGTGTTGGASGAGATTGTSSGAGPSTSGSPSQAPRPSASPQ